MRSLTFIIPILLLSTFISCTGNDLFDDEVKLSNNTISGTVKLEDQSDHSGIYVWFPLFDKGTYTDKKGDFSFTLPSNFKQNGLGYFQFYFYVNDYVLQKDSVTIRDGKFEYGTGNVDNNGNVINSYSLNRIFTLSIYESTELPVFKDVKKFKWIKIHLKQATEVIYPMDSLRLVGKEAYYQVSSFQVFKDNEIKDNSLIFTKNKSITFSDDYLILIKLDALQNMNLTNGVYEILPFIYCKQKNIPDELINNLSEEPFTINEFFKLPNRFIKFNFELTDSAILNKLN